MAKEMNKKLVLENGMEFAGTGFGADREVISELVFNTSMVGYQEIISDPSYTGQTVTMSYPLIGNYGITDDDFESRSLMLSGLIVREINDDPSNFRYTRTLSETLIDNGVPGVSGIDTRKLVRVIRDYGSCKAMITDSYVPAASAVRRMNEFTLPTNQVSLASCKKRWFSRTPDQRFTVVAIDCGIKMNIIRSLNKLGCNMIIVPYNTPASAVMALKPDGIFLSNGPGDPQNVPEVIELIRQLRGKYPIFGICLGHQLISLAYGASTYKLKFGHRGGNHPVKDLRTGKISITSQNHSYAVDADSLASTGLRVTHINILDNTVEGVECPEDRIYSVQYHPESAPGPQDSFALFDKFIAMMEEAANA